MKHQVKLNDYDKTCKKKLQIKNDLKKYKLIDFHFVICVKNRTDLNIFKNFRYCVLIFLYIFCFLIIFQINDTVK